MQWLCSQGSIMLNYFPTKKLKLLHSKLCQHSVPIPIALTFVFFCIDALLMYIITMILIFKAMNICKLLVPDKYLWHCTLVYLFIFAGNYTLHVQRAYMQWIFIISWLCWRTRNAKLLIATIAIIIPCIHSDYIRVINLYVHVYSMYNIL